MRQIPPGPLMVDIADTALSPLDCERLCHPLVGGVILFSRNYESPDQLAALCAAIHGLRTPALLIAVDHEGGRVQRFRNQFTRLPAMRELGRWWDRDAAAALKAARAIGFVLAAELRACGVDLSFTPVLDLDYGASAVIGDRALHRSARAVGELANALNAGLRHAGMAACGKHFPGHGHVAADSHVAIPVDDRKLEQMQDDLEPYGQVLLDAVMPAHVIYTRLDDQPAGFSRYWLGKLRRELGFDGVIFSDDLSMEGASVAGDIVARAEAAWAAGCDMLLVCNAPDAVAELLARWRPIPVEQRRKRVLRLMPKQALPRDETLYGEGRAAIAALAGN